MDPLIESSTRTDLEDFYAAVDGNDFAGAVQFLSVDIDWAWGGVARSGRAAVHKCLGGGGGSLTERKHHITTYTQGRGRAAAELRVTARHAGPLFLPTGPIPASGAMVDISACHVLRVGADGRFDVSHVYINFVGLLAQIAPTTN